MIVSFIRIFCFISFFFHAQDMRIFNRFNLNLSCSSIFLGVGALSALNALKHLSVIQPNLKDQKAELRLMIDEKTKALDFLKMKKNYLRNNAETAYKEYQESIKSGNEKLINVALNRYSVEQSVFNNFLSEDNSPKIDEFLKKAQRLMIDYDKEIKWSYYKCIGYLISSGGIFACKIWKFFHFEK